MMAWTKVVMVEVMTSGQILKIEPPGFAGRLAVSCERKGGVRDSCSDLSPL